jgi:hypothetical protein
VDAVELFPWGALAVVEGILHLGPELLSSLQDLQEVRGTLLILINVDLLPRFELLLQALLSR